MCVTQEIRAARLNLCYWQSAQQGWSQCHLTPVKGLTPLYHLERFYFSLWMVINSVLQQLYQNKSDEVENFQNWLSKRLCLKNFMKQHNSVSLETVNMTKEVLSFAAKRKKASIMEALEKHLTALLHQLAVIRRNSPLPVVNGSLNKMATPIAPQKCNHIIYW